jgi:hypothetical protein
MSTCREGYTNGAAVLQHMKEVKATLEVTKTWQNRVKIQQISVKQ